MVNENTNSNGLNSRNKEAKSGPRDDGTARATVQEVHHHYHYGHGFNFGKLFFGLLVVFFGLYYLARNTGWLPVDLQINWILIWPILIIFAGLSLLTGRSWLTAIIGIITTLIVIVAVVVMLFGGQIGGGKTIWPFWQMGSSSDYNQNENVIKEQAVAVTKDDAAKSAVLSLKARAGKVSIKGGAEGLVMGKYRANFGSLATSSKLENSLQSVDLETFGPGPMMMFGSPSSNLDLNMTTQIPLKLNISTGASSMELDLTRLVLEQLDIEAGASSLKLALGDKAKMNKVKIKAGASSVEVEVPRTAGVKIVLDSALGSLNLEGFDKIDDRNFQTSSYYKSDKKIDLNFELGVSSLQVKLK
jgi:hypothetical protein